MILLKRISDGATAFLSLVYAVLAWLFNSSLMTMLLLFVPILIGILAKGHEGEILSFWSYKNGFEFTDAARQFYLYLSIYVVAYAFREKVKSSHLRERESELVRTIRTLPPHDVLEKFHFLFTDIRLYISEEIDDAGDPDARKESIVRGIRICLNSLAVLTASFHRSSNGTRYATNFMRYKSFKEMHGDECLAIVREASKFMDHSCPDSLDGVLELDVALSATSTSKNPFEIDDAVQKLILPVPIEPRSLHNDKTRCLPGAPTAFRSGHDFVNDTLKILENYDKAQTYEIVRGVFENMDEYFRKDKAGKQVRSFVSIAVPSLEASPGAPGRTHSLGVINIHSNKPDLFMDDLAFHSYRYLVTPIVEQISYLAALRP